MDNLVADTTGLIHVIASTTALISGSLVLLMKKGTRIPDAPFMGAVGIATLGIIVAGGIGYNQQGEMGRHLPHNRALGPS